ncbi:MAG: glycerol-3-phosphate dehydrogenase [Pseudomonadota bacterium]
MPATDFDLIVIGGGINGAGIARDAQGRGLRVLLVEQDDLAQHTSSASTKLIHGGLRYLEYYEFRLVRKALQEREVLLRAAPHIIRPMRFVMPHDQSMRPEWLIRAGLFLYDRLSKRELLPGSETVQLSTHPAGPPLREQYHKGFVYSDGWVDDARLVVLNALDARERGATILTRTCCVGAERLSDRWQIRLRDQISGVVSIVSARALVNAAGPWVASLLRQELNVQSSHALRLVKGSHIIVPKLFDHAYAYIFQNPDRRIIFAIPYERDFTLIGTTDIEYRGDPAKVVINDDEVRYLCEMANRYFRKMVEPADVVRTYSGVRPLLDDTATNAASVTRDYWLELNTSGGAPVLSVFGGKITTYRRLAEEALESLLDALKMPAHCWTALAPLPGGDIPGGDFERFLAAVRIRYSWLPEATLYRLAHAYGTRIHGVLCNAQSVAELGEEIFPGFYLAELQYLCDEEWAQTTDDILWRRTKLGLRVTEDGQKALMRSVDFMKRSNPA